MLGIILKRHRLQKYFALSMAFLLAGCATAEDVNNRYKDLHVANLLPAERVFVGGFNSLEVLPIPTQYRGKNPTYAKCDENRWNLLNQAPPEVRRACAKILNSNALIKVAKKLINNPYQFENGDQVRPPEQ